MNPANHLHFYGELDVQDHLGGEAFQWAYAVHSRFATDAYAKFGKTDLYLRTSGAEVLVEARGLHQTGKLEQAYGLYRGAVHMVAMNGTFGPEAEKYVDPYAFLKKTK